MFTNIRIKRIMRNYFYEIGGLVKARSTIKRSMTENHSDKTELQDLREKIHTEEYFLTMHNKIREESLQKIAKLNIKAINPLISIYEESDSDFDRSLAFEALIRLKDERVNSIIDKALKDKNPEIRKLAEKAKKT